MSFYYSSDSLTDIHKVLMMTLHDDFDYESAPRGKPIRELVAASFTLTDPRNRLIASPARNVNYGFAVGELCWYLRGDRDLETMHYYNRRMGQFSDDGVTINSAYGYRMFRNRWGGASGGMATISQLDLIIEELKSDPDSRRAVMHINETSDLLHAVERGSKDVPCTMSLQLLIRDRKLHMHVLMRSNDIVWGVPYDVFSFTCLQEVFLNLLMARGAAVDELGSYHHTAGSLHLYDTHFTMAEDVAKEPEVVVAPMMPFALDHIELLAHRYEPDIRLNGCQELAWLGGDTPNEVDWMVDQLFKHREKREAEAARKKAAPPAAVIDDLSVETSKEIGDQQT